MNGDRFKKRLPKFVGQISDVSDLFNAEDTEFSNIDSELEEFAKSMIISDIEVMENPMETLIRYEYIFGLGHPNQLSIKDRINRILVKLAGADTTTRELIIKICESYGHDASFISKYEEYGFTVEFDGTFPNDVLLKSIREMKPAHLELLISIILRNLLYIGMYGQSSRYSTMKQADFITEQENRLYFATQNSRTRIINTIAIQPKIKDMEKENNLRVGMQVVQVIRYTETEIKE